ncbi:MAG: type I restriction-modification system subunit M N-terminal domain-containing protein, partial [Geodermatophilaceae bacterium]
MAAPSRESIRTHAAFIWSVADLLRGDYKQSEYSRVILPLPCSGGWTACWSRRRTRSCSVPQLWSPGDRRAVLQHVTADDAP